MHFVLNLIKEHTFQLTFLILYLLDWSICNHIKKNAT